MRVGSPRWGRWAVAAVVMVVLAGLASPAVAAPWRVTEALPFQGNLGVPASADAWDEGAFVLSGGLSYASSVHGIVALFGAHGATKVTADRIRVFDAADPLAYHLDQPAFAATDAVFVPDAGGSLFWSVPNGTATVEAPYAFGVLFALEANLPDLGGFQPDRSGPPPPSLVADARSAPWTVSTGAERSRLLPAIGGFTVQSGGDVQTFRPGDWVVELEGARAGLQGIGIAVPLEDDAEAVWRSAAPADFENAFSLHALDRFLVTAEGLADSFRDPATAVSRDVCPPPFCPIEANGDGGLQSAGLRAAEDEPVGGTEGPLREHGALLERLGALLNGALFGRLAAGLEIAGLVEPDPGFTLLRITELKMRPAGAEAVHVAGSSPLAYTGGGVVHDESVVPVGPVFLTTLAIALYVLAVVAFAVARFARLRPMDPLRDRRWRPAAIATGIVGLGVFGVLLDREVHFLLGTSFLGGFGAWGGGASLLAPVGPSASLAAGPLLLVQLAAALVVALLYAVPLTAIGVALMRLGGLGRPLVGFAVGPAAVAAWALGAPLVRPLLDAALRAALGA